MTPQCGQCGTDQKALDFNGFCADCVDAAKVSLAGMFSGGSTKDYSAEKGSGFSREETAIAAKFGCRRKGSCNQRHICEMVNGCANGLDEADVSYIMHNEEEVKREAYGGLCAECLEPIADCECTKPDPRYERLRERVVLKAPEDLKGCARCGVDSLHVFPVTVRHRDVTIIARHRNVTTINMMCCPSCIDELSAKEGAVGNAKTGYLIDITDETPIYLRNDGAPLFGQALDHPGKSTGHTP